MSQTRVPVEWLFNEIETYFKFVSYVNIEYLPIFELSLT